MKDQKHESGEELIDETGRNQTQQRMDQKGVEDKPVVAVADAGQRPKAAADAVATREPRAAGAFARVRRLLRRG